MGQTDSRTLLQSLEEPSVTLSQSCSNCDSLAVLMDAEAVSMESSQSIDHLEEQLESPTMSVELRRSHRQRGTGVRKSHPLAKASSVSNSFPHFQTIKRSMQMDECTSSIVRPARKYSVKSRLRRFLRLPKSRTSPVLKPSPKGAFSHLPDEICLHVLKMMDMPLIGKMSQVSRTWNRLCSTDLIYRWNAVQRFAIHPSRIPLLMRDVHLSEEFWKTLYIQFDSGLTAWTGLALDPVTNSSRPYSIELLMKNVRHRLQLGTASSRSSASSRLSSTSSRPSKYLRLSEFDGCCRWTDLGNALTKIEGTLTDSMTSTRFERDPFLGKPVARIISFDETAIIYGQDLAIPNRYHGLLVGNIMLGTYNPGHPSLIGSFGIIMDDSLPYLTPYKLSLNAGNTYKGHLFLASDSVAPHDMSRYVQLTITQATTTSLEARFTVYPTASAQISLQSRMDSSQDANGMTLNVEMEATMETTLHPFLNESTVSFSSARFKVCINDSLSGLASQWLPIEEDFHLFLRGNCLFGLFSTPSAGTFYVTVD